MRIYENVDETEARRWRGLLENPLPPKAVRQCDRSIAPSCRLFLEFQKWQYGINTIYDIDPLPDRGFFIYSKEVERKQEISLEQGEPERDKNGAERRKRENWCTSSG